MILEATMTLMLAASSSSELLGDVKKLNVLGSALFVAAHPDDENTRLLATLANETRVRAAYLSLTRGEGGQNLIGQDLGPVLGMIRTQELLAARRVDGAEQFFTRARDFGYSKSVDETLLTWDHDTVLADTVYVIRTLRPDVIIARFPLEAGETHGHHTASARIALEAFIAAADPKFHPEHFETVKPWQAKRIFWNAWSPDPKKQPDLSKAITMDGSAWNPLLGQTYGELAALSRSMHKSQGFGAAPVHGPSPENFVLLGGDPAAKTIFDGVDLSWKRVPGSAALVKLLEQAAAELKADKPQASLPTLLAAQKAMAALPDHPWKQRKLAEIGEVIAACAGLFVEATSPTYGTVPGAKLDVNVLVVNRTGAAAALKEVRWSDGQTTKPTELKVSVTVPPALSTPDWLSAGPLTPAQAIAPEPPPALWADFVFDGGFTLRRPVLFKWTDPTAGERFRPIEILPPVVMKADARLLVFADAAAKPWKVALTANADGQSGELKPAVPEGWVVTPASAPYTLAKRGDGAELVFQVKPGPKASGGALTLPGVGLTRVEHAHIPIQTLLTPVETKLVRVALNRGKVTKVGYIPGAGDEVPHALRQVGYEVTLLDDEALTGKPLAGFDAIVVGIRAYNVNPKLQAARAKLMAYVAGGGTLVVQYNTSNRISEVPAELGPYPFEISRDRVTDEKAAVVGDAHAVMKKPNAIAADDFDGWVQERGLYFAAKWDPQYATPLSMNDPNEPAKKGSLLIAKSGKGTFVYTGLAFFRQLPAGVPGAYRLFANVLAHGR